MHSLKAFEPLHLFNKMIEMSPKCGSHFTWLSNEQCLSSLSTGPFQWHYYVVADDSSEMLVTLWNSALVWLSRALPEHLKQLNTFENNAKSYNNCSYLLSAFLLGANCSKSSTRLCFGLLRIYRDASFALMKGLCVNNANTNSIC